MQEAVVIILDVGASMSAQKHHKSKKTADQDATPPLEGALKAVNLLVQQKVSY